jgi:hypothetical protein
MFVVTSARDGGVLSVLIPGRFITSTHWVWRWMAPTSGLNFVEKIKVSYPSKEVNPDHSARHYAELVIQAPRISITYNLL